MRGLYSVSPSLTVLFFSSSLTRGRCHLPTQQPQREDLLFLVASADFSEFTWLIQLGHMPISDPNTGVKGICSWPGFPLEVPWHQLERVPLSLGRRSPMPCEDTGLGGRNFSLLCRYHLSRCSQRSWICRLPGLGHGPTCSGCGAPPTQSS